MDQSPASCRYDGRQRTTRRHLREILDDLDRQDRALLRVSSDLLDTIAALKEAHELSLKHRPWTSSAVRGDEHGTVNTGTGPAGTATIEGGSTGLWTCTTEKSS
ncbi:uncharacterized protein LOC119737853 [Patiria miniata]|uniref:Uncharacterized protein n=1 Tax=Patiria miniata TaxID=46514 RepID=A0A914AY14_PATMI|nr:uncharacterized protein LOC119737853 [Patiria miniata]